MSNASIALQPLIKLNKQTNKQQYGSRELISGCFYLFVVALLFCFRCLFVCFPCFFVVVRLFLFFCVCGLFCCCCFFGG